MTSQKGRNLIMLVCGATLQNKSYVPSFEQSILYAHNKVRYQLQFPVLSERDGSVDRNCDVLSSVTLKSIFTQRNQSSYDWQAKTTSN